MKNKLLSIVAAITLLSLPTVNFGQAPNLGTASNFALFTSVGAFAVTGNAAFVTGDVGTNAGAFSAFPPGTLNGAIHVANPTSTQAAIDVDAAYNDLFGRTCGLGIPTSLGPGQTLMPNTYCLLAASTLTGNLTLDGGGNPNSIFIFKINGAFRAFANSSITLTNGASLCNVYWQINGEVNLENNTAFQGTLLVNGAIHLFGNATLMGRALSRAGALDLENNVVTIPAAGTPTITASGPTTFCQGGSVTLTSSPASGYIWERNGVVIANTQSINVTTSGNYKVTTTGSCGGMSAITVVTVQNAPTPPTIAANGPTTFCSGGSVTLTASSAGAGGGYIWRRNGLVILGEIAQTLNVTTSGSYTVETTGMCGGMQSAPVVVTVNPTPSSTITPSGPTTFCQGGSVTLQAPIAAGNTYLWSTGETTSSIVVMTSGSYTVAVTNGPCTSISTPPTVVTVIPMGAAIPTITPAGPILLCLGGSVMLTSSPATSYVWRQNGVIIAPTTQTITVMPGLGMTNYTVTTPATACGTGGTSVATVVTVNPNPIATITAGGPTTICPGGSVVLTAAGAVGNTYLWSTGERTQSITVTAAGNYSVVVTNGGCSATSAVIVVTVNPIPTITSRGITTFCIGNCIKLTASAGSSYLWSNGETTQCISATVSGNYTVTVPNANGCSSTSAATVITVFDCCLCRKN